MAYIKTEWKDFPDETTPITSANLQKIEDALAGMLDYFYPIGTIYKTTSTDLDTPTKMGNHFGGTWEAWGTGRVPVGINASDTYFDTVEKTGGNKVAHSGLSVAIGKILSVNSHNVPGFPYTLYGSTTRTVTSGSQSGSGGYTVDPNDNFKYEGANLQPYIVCYMWKRTA